MISFRTMSVAMFAVAAASPVPAPAQNAVTDSAAVARAAWQRAITAFQAKDTPAARREVEHAAAAWPTQPAYVWGRAVVAAQASDTVAILDALRAYANLGLGRDLHIDPRFAGLLERPDFADVARVHDANRVSIAASSVRATLPDSTFWPEGMDVDARTGTIYVASVRHGTIAAFQRDGQTRELLARNSPNIGAILGVRVDAKHGVVWATTSGIPQAEGYVPADSAISALLRIRISDGRIERRWNLPVAPGGHVLGDLALGASGDVYFTDSNEPVLYRLRAGGDTLEHFTHPLFHNLQGMAPTANPNVLYVADYSHGLLRVDLARKEVTRLPDAPHSTSLGCDGIAWDRGAIICVQNGVAPARVMRFALDGSGRAITSAVVLDRNAAVAGEPTIGAIANGEFLYVANSQWDEHDEKGALIPDAVLGRPIILALPLTH